MFKPVVEIFADGGVLVLRVEAEGAAFNLRHPVLHAGADESHTLAAWTDQPGAAAHRALAVTRRPPALTAPHPRLLVEQPRELVQ